MRSREPANLEAEQAVLGCFLLDASAVEKAATILQEGDFHLLAHRFIFEAARTLHARGQPIEALTLSEVLSGLDIPMQPGRTQMEAVGSLVYLHDLRDAPTTAENIAYYAGIVKKCALRREVMHRAREAYFLAKNSEDGLQVIAHHNGRYHFSALVQETEEDGAPALCLADVKPERVEWLWPGYIPLGMLTVICGDGGMGKGTLSIDLAARLSRGQPMPLNELPGEPVNTLLLTTAEDDLRRAIVPRLIAAGADLRHIFSPEEDTVYSLPDNVPDIERLVKKHRARFVVIDPLMSYLSSRLNAYRDQDIRQALTPLKAMAETTRAAVVIIAHVNKLVGAQAGQRVSGSVAIRNAARRLFFVGEFPSDRTKRVLAFDKGNIGKPPPSLLFSIEDTKITHGGEYFDDLPCIVWRGVTDCTANALVAPPMPEDTEARGARKDAQTFLREALKDGPVESDALRKQWRAQGFADATINRAKRDVAGSRRVGGMGSEGSWEWYLLAEEPEQDEDADALRLSSPPKILTLSDNREVRNLGDNLSEASGLEEGEL